MKLSIRSCFSFIILVALGAGCQKQADVPKHVFLIVIGTLRPDHLGCYGYKAPTSPTIDGLAREGVVFTNAYATSSNTLESVFSFLNCSTALTNNVHIHTPAEIKYISVGSIQKYLKRAGFRTLAVISNPWLKAYQDYFQDGFNHVKFVGSKSWGIPNTTELVTGTVSDFLTTKLDRKGKNFFFIYYLDPHDPCRPPADYGFFSGVPPRKPPSIHDLSGEEALRARLEEEPDYTGLPTPEPLAQNDLNYMVSQYDGEIRYVDAHIKKLVDKLRAMKILDDSLLIITSDHGEEFLDHGLFKHGFQLYDSSIRIPLIFYWKDHLTPQTKDKVVSGMDMPPTILALCGLDVPAAMLGSDVFTKSGEEPVLFCTHYVNQDQRGMRKGRWKLIENVATDEMMLFDMVSDPGERNNLFADPLAPREELLKSYKRLLAKHVVKKGQKKAE
jgi:arylsulfatase A-like enzyme